MRTFRQPYRLYFASMGYFCYLLSIYLFVSFPDTCMRVPMHAPTPEGNSEDNSVSQFFAPTQGSAHHQARPSSAETARWSLWLQLYKIILLVH